MSSERKRKTFIFFTPHPDDIELGCPFMYLEALRHGYNVIEVVATNGEFGTENDAFKGRRLVKIRNRELATANTVFEKHAQNRIKVIYLGYVDGYLPVNKEALDKVSNIIRRECADVIFTPDPVYPQDYHPDHVVIGKLVYYSLFRLPRDKLPRVFYYYSTRTKRYFKCSWKDFPIIETALGEHRSQYSPLAVKLITGLYNKLSLFRHLIERASVSESFREQQYSQGLPLAPTHFNFYERVVYYMFSTVTLWGVKQLHNLTPEEIGLDRTKIYSS